MNRKIFVTASALLLAAVGVFAGRASVKATATSLSFKTAGGNCKELFSSAIPSVLTTIGTGTQAQILTETSATWRFLYTQGSGNACGKQVYLKN